MSDEPKVVPTGGTPEGDGGKERSRKVVVFAALLLVTGGTLGGLWKAGLPPFSGGHFAGDGHGHAGGKGDDAVVAAEKYTCGMHPFVISDKPGICPICQMALTKIEVAPPSRAAKGPDGRTILYYRNPMDPMVTSPVPMKDSMGMDYVPVYADEAGGTASGGGGSGSPEGYATVNVGAERMALAGIQSVPAVRESIGRSIRATGVVVVDETRVRRVQAKVDGWIEKLHANFIGQVVAKGEPLMEVYSPELLSTQQEYLKTREAAAKFASSSSEDVRKLGDDLLKSSRRRLELFDVPPGFIAELERTGTARRTVTLVAPVGGYVTGKEINEGTRVSPGTDLLTVTDLSHVWVEADLYEAEASSVKVGQSATLVTAADPASPLKGRIAFIYPTLSPETRTLKVRFDFPNPGLRLKPQMYADVSLDINRVTGVVIPDSALIDTGVRRIVFVDGGDGSFEPREVKVGVRGDGKAQILSGVKEGEKVAIRANFLLDSESKLRAALTKMTGPTAGAGK